MLQASPGGDEMNVGMHRIGKIGEGNTKTTTIDSLELNECDLIHLDAEGHEVPILYGAADTSDTLIIITLNDLQNNREYIFETYSQLFTSHIFLFYF